jgi:hypothetical protein
MIMLNNHPHDIPEPLQNRQKYCTWGQHPTTEWLTKRNVGGGITPVYSFICNECQKKREENAERALLTARQQWKEGTGYA